MAEFEYKTVVAPVTPKKYKGVKSLDERFARTLADAMNEAAAGGWRFERTEEFKCMVSKGALRGSELEDRLVMIFSREKQMRGPTLAVEPKVDSDTDARTEPTV